MYPKGQKGKLFNATAKKEPSPDNAVNSAFGAAVQSEKLAGKS
jgi:hypothetical protein